MRFWLLTTEFPPFAGGGISTYCLHTVKMMAARGHEVTVFVNDSAVNNYEEETVHGGRLVRFNPFKTEAASCLGHVTAVAYGFAGIVKTFTEKEGKPDIIEAQEYLGIAYYLLNFKYLRYEWCSDVPVLITMHSPSFLYLEYNHVPAYQYPNYWIGEMERFSIRAADALVSPSGYLLQEVAKRFSFDLSQAFVVPNPYEPANKPAVKSGGGDIVFFGKLSVQKGTFKLLEYFSKLWSEGFEEPLYLIGGQDIVYHPEGRTMGDLVRDRYKLFIGNGLLRLEDKLPQERIAERLAAARLVIVPSTVENFPYVVLEMMSLGLVVLVSKQGGQAEIVERDLSGFIFDHEEEGSFARELRKALSLPPAEREAMSEKAVARIRELCNPERVYQQKMRILEDLAGSKKTAAAFPFVHPSFPPLKQSAPAPGQGLLSIVVPYYNMGDFIDETMASIVRSGFASREIILVNDGSTEKASLEKLEQYRNQPGIRVIDSPNRGLGGARNLGAEAASGNWLAFLDADDKVEPDYYEKAIRVLSYYGEVHFVGAWTRYFEGSEKIWATFHPEPPLILFHNLVNSSALVYRRESFLEGGKNDTGMPFQGLEDYDSVVSMVSKGYRGVVLPETLFQYRVRRNSMIRGISKTKKLVLYEYISKKHEQFYANFAIENFNLLNTNGPGIILDNPTLDYFGGRLPFNRQWSQKLIRVIKRNHLARQIAYRIYRIFN